MNLSEKVIEFEKRLYDTDAMIIKADNITSPNIIQVDDETFLKLLDNDKQKYIYHISYHFFISGAYCSFWAKEYYIKHPITDLFFCVKFQDECEACRRKEKCDI